MTSMSSCTGHGWSTTPWRIRVRTSEAYCFARFSQSVSVLGSRTLLARSASRRSAVPAQGPGKWLRAEIAPFQKAPAGWSSISEKRFMILPLCAEGLCADTGVGWFVSERAAGSRATCSDEERPYVDAARARHWPVRPCLYPAASPVRTGARPATKSSSMPL